MSEWSLSVGSRRVMRLQWITLSTTHILEHRHNYLARKADRQSLFLLVITINRSSHKHLTSGGLLAMRSDLIIMKCSAVSFMNSVERLEKDLGKSIGAKTYTDDVALL